MILSIFSCSFWPSGCLLWRNVYLCLLPIFHGEGNGTPLQYSCLENPMDGGAWWATVHGVAKSQTRLNDFPFTFHFHALEKEMATHSSVLAWSDGGVWWAAVHGVAQSRTQLKWHSSSSSSSSPFFEWVVCFDLVKYLELFLNFRD